MNKNFYIIIKILVLLFCLFSCNSFQQKKENLKTIKNNKPIKNNIEDIQERYTTSKKQNIDSLHSKTLSELVVFSYNEEDWGAFHKYRLEHLNTPSLNQYVKTNSLLLDYSGEFFWNQNRLDSAYHYYYQAYKSYDLLKDSLRAGNMLLNTAIIQKNSRDYTGSESASFKALSYLESTDNERRMASVFNNLGIIYMYFEDYQNALKYHSKAYKIRRELTRGKILELHSLNNIGNVYKKKKDFKEAILFYTRALEKDSVLQKYPKIAAMLTDNFAHAQFLNGEYKRLPQLFFKALKIRDSINDVPGTIVSYLHLGEYYKKKGNKETAINYLQKAQKTAEAILYPKDQIEAMGKLIDLYPSSKGLQIAKRIIYLQDSIQKVDRMAKDQYSRIRYETLKKEKIILLQEKKLQEKELDIKRRTIIFLVIIIIVIAFALISLLLWFKKYRQRQKFKFGFSKYLQEKYKLTPKNLEFWQELIKGQTEQELAETLYLSINSIKSRRKTLFSKIKSVINDDNFDKTKAVILYKKEFEIYKKNG